MFTKKNLSAILTLSGITTAHSQTEICRAACSTDDSGEEICKFTAKVNLYASELGYYQFEECGDVDNPTIGMEVGKIYHFLQTDPSNHMHPLGFAYYPDGAHDDKDELEPGVVPPGSSSDCDAELTCQSPKYILNSVYLGSLEDLENFGLDDYEPKFFHPLTEWLGYGDFSVYLKLDADTDYEQDLFYFCHIHQYMSGRIKILKDDVPIQTSNLPELGYEYDKPEGHDTVCGTYGLNQYQLPNEECPEKFVCDTQDQTEGLQQFSQCIDSMNCAMMAGMTTSVKGSSSETALFIHQMIPHHQNAVNMAKALLKADTLKCDDLTDEESEQAADCTMEVILRSIISEQNAQIQTMRGILDDKGYPQENDCKVIFTSEQTERRARRRASRRNNPRNNQIIEREMTQVRRNAEEGELCLGACSTDGASGEEICTFTAVVNLFASELGYYQFKECGDVNNPTLGVEIGKMYHFLQSDPSNHMHPLGFAYYPDGAHADVDELEPGIVPPDSSSTCDADLTCPAPRYFLNDKYLGSQDELENFGLDDYEPKFFHPLPEWEDYGEFCIALKFDEDYDKDLFYFCHIHEYMSGRIKLLKDGVPVQDEDIPTIDYEYDVPGVHDTECGTYGLDDFQLPHTECPEVFVCDTENENEGLQKFAKCIDSMNCHMMAGMSSSVYGDTDEVALFIHQMIPHHQNAVNMAKALIRADTLKCEDLTDDENPDCAMEVILRHIISGQNHQIQLMRGVLEAKNLPMTNDCIVEVDGKQRGYAADTSIGPKSSKSTITNPELMAPPNLTASKAQKMAPESAKTHKSPPSGKSQKAPKRV